MVDKNNDSNWNATHNAGNRFRITYFDIYILGVTGYFESDWRTISSVNQKDNWL